MGPVLSTRSHEVRPTSALNAETDQLHGEAAVSSHRSTIMNNLQKIRHSAAARPIDFSGDPRLSPGTRKFLEALNGSGGAPLETLSPEDARVVLAQTQAAMHVELLGIEESQHTITAGAFTLELDLVRPANSHGILPAFMFVHGGGWVLGDYPTHRRLVRDLVVRTGYAAVFVNYSRTPEVRYPQPVEEVYAATKWVAEHGGEDLRVDGNRLAIVGSSVGGNMSAVTCILAKERGGPALKQQILLWPTVDHDFDTESYRQFGMQRFLTRSLMMWMYDLYTTDPSQRREVRASPLRATSEQLRGLPQALIVVAENDILRDEGEAYGRKLEAAGVEVATVRFDGMIHDFGMLNGLAREPGTLAMLDLMAARLRLVLGAP